MNRINRLFGSAFVAVWLFCVAALVLAQATPVDLGVTSGVNWGVIGIVLLLVLVAIGFAYWHRKNSASADAALVEAHAQIVSLAHGVVSHVGQLIERIPVAMQQKAPPGKDAQNDSGAALDPSGVSTQLPTPKNPPAGQETSIPAIPAPSAVAFPTTEQLAAIDAAQLALDRARAAAGLPPT